MGLYSIELTPAEMMDQQSVFQQEMADLLGCRQLTILPPFPDYSLLSQNHSPKALLKVVNEVILSRRPAYEKELGWLLLPLVRGEGVLGVLFAEEVDQKYADAENLVFLERLARLCIDRLQWEKRGWRDGETSLWRREVLMKEVNRVIDLAESGGSLTPRRLLGDGPRVARFTFICFAVTPAPDSWAGAGPIWQQLGPQLAELLPNETLAAHLGGGYVGIYWPKAKGRDAHLWVERLHKALSGSDRKTRTGDQEWDLAAGIVRFPEDFYDDGPSLPWEKSDLGVKLTAADEVMRRATLTAETAKEKDETILAYKTLRARGLVKLESAIEKRLSSLVADNEPGALLLVKLDDWKVWQRQHGPKRAANRAKRVLTACEGECPAGAVLDWAGPDRFGVFLPDADVDSAQERGRAIRQRIKSALSTTVQMGISVYPCPGFAKQDMLDNGRKALIHTDFFGPDTQTVFDATSLNISGDRFYESGRLEEAVQEFQKALTLDADNVNVHNSLGVCYANMGKFEEAVAEFSRVTELEPNDFMAHYNLGCALLSLTRKEEAEHAFSQAAALEPDNAAAHFQLAKLCRKRDKLEEALTHLGRTVNLNPNWAKAWRLFGECFLEQGNHEEAMDAFKKALKINGEDGAALSGLALLYGRTETNLEVALSLARRSVELNPTNALFAQRLVELLLQNRELEEAMAQCERAVSMAPEDEQLRLLQEKITAAQRLSTS